MSGYSGYSGHVEPDGVWEDRRDGRLFVRKLSVGEMDNDVYVVADAETGDAVLIDAAAEPERLREAMDGFAVQAVLQTHGHWDHVRAWDALRDEDGLTICGHPDDADLFPREVDRELHDGDRVQIGALEIEVLHTPGHTPGACQFLVRGEERPHLFTGDSLFPGGPGRTTSPENFTQLMDNLERRVFNELPDETWIYPGHGDDTTVGAERPSLPEWRARGW